MKLFRFLMLIISLVAPCTAIAQFTNAAILGTVDDEQNRLIVGARVTTINTQTGAATSTTTNDSGMYIFSTLTPGTYRVEVDKVGFKGIIKAGILLHVQDALQINFHMAVGSMSETVTVASEGGLLNTNSSSIGMVVNEDEVSQLPLNGRDPQSLVFLAPGVTNGTNYVTIAANQADFAFPGETGASVGAGGGREGGTNYLLDGASNNDDYLGLAAPFPNADATQEFRVITNNFNAQYGFAPGAVVLIATKSGTNNWHGGAWDFLRNQSFNASNWFSHSVNPLHQNQFGADLGGPVLKNKLFFFTNYQGTRASSASTAGLEYTYTTAMLNGDFSGLPVTLKAPFQTVNGKPNQINPALFNSTAVKVMQLIMPVSPNPNGQLHYTTAKQLTNYDEGTGRIDYDISHSQRVFARAFINYYNQPESDVPGNLLADVVANPEEDYNLAIGHTWIINPKLVNEVTLSNTQMDFKQNGQALTSNNQSFCWSKYINVNEPSGTCSFEHFNLAGLDQFPLLEPCQNNHGNDGVSDNFSAEERRHNLSFGVNIVRRWMANPCSYPAYPILYFEPTYTNYALTDFFLGDLFLIAQGAGNAGAYSNWQLGLYAQDEFRYRPNLTFEIGLRWDPDFPVDIADGRGATFVPGEQSTVYPNAPTGLVFPGDPGIGPGLTRTSYGYWQPRIGVAWQPHALPHASFHAGFGLFTAPLNIDSIAGTDSNSPFAPTFIYEATATTPLSFNNPWSGFAGTGGVSPFPPFTTSTYKPPSSATFTNGLSVGNSIDPNAKLGITQSWNIAAEYELGSNMMARVAYVGSESYDQMYGVDKNPGIYASGGARSTYPKFGQILYDQSVGTASYNGLQVTFERRLSRGLQFLSNWTWSKLIDTSITSGTQINGLSSYDPFNLRSNRGISLANFPFIWVSNAIYTTPSLSGHNQLVRQTLGGWEMSAIITSQSGQSFTVLGGFGSNNSESQQDRDHANLVPGVPFNVRQGGRSHWVNNYFNVNAFTENPAGTFGNTGKDIMKGPPYNDIDAGIDKNWQIFEKYRLQFRWEMFNALNHPSFSLPNATNQINSTGTNVGGPEGTITSIFGTPRIMQGALKLTF